LFRFCPAPLLRGGQLFFSRIFDKVSSSVVVNILKKISRNFFERGSPIGRPARIKYMFFVYVLQSLRDRKTYVGYTYELEQRLQKHNSGQVKSTKNRRPLRLLFTENFETEKEAKKENCIGKAEQAEENLENILID